MNGTIGDGVAVVLVKRKISRRCGKESCEFYNKHNKTSGCFKFDDRQECSISMKQRRRVAYKSRTQPEQFNW
jgi:hypothetical protein